MMCPNGESFCEDPLEYPEHLVDKIFERLESNPDPNKLAFFGSVEPIPTSDEGEDLPPEESESQGPGGRNRGGSGQQQPGNARRRPVTGFGGGDTRDGGTVVQNDREVRYL